MILVRLISGVALTATLGLAGCTTTSNAKIPPYQESTIVQRVSADTGIPGSSIAQHARCRTGYVLPGQAEVRMDECVYIATAGWAALLRYDTAVKRYNEVARIDPRALGIAYKTHQHMVGKSEQVQIKDARGYRLFDFFNDGLLTAYAAIKGFGVPEIPGRDYVQPIVKPDPITIYVPVGR